MNYCSRTVPMYSDSLCTDVIKSDTIHQINMEQIFKQAFNQSFALYKNKAHYIQMAVHLTLL